MTSHPGFDMQINLYAIHDKAFMDRLWSELTKVKHRRTHAANRTHTARHRAGSRRNKHHPVARFTRRCDIYSGYDTIGDWACPPDHHKRFADISDLFPPAPGASDNLAKRWP